VCSALLQTANLVKTKSTLTLNKKKSTFHSNQWARIISRRRRWADSLFVLEFGPKMVRSALVNCVTLRCGEMIGRRWLMAMASDTEAICCANRAARDHSHLNENIQLQNRGACTTHLVDWNCLPTNTRLICPSLCFDDWGTIAKCSSELFLFIYT
jgi:ribosomal protein S20